MVSFKKYKKYTQDILNTQRILQLHVHVGIPQYIWGRRMNFILESSIGVNIFDNNSFIANLFYKHCFLVLFPGSVQLWIWSMLSYQRSCLWQGLWKPTEGEDIMSMIYLSSYNVYCIKFMLWLDFITIIEKYVYLSS